MRAGRPCAQPDSVGAGSGTAVTSSGPAGTTSARSLALGASTPWFAQRESAHFAKRSYAHTNRIRCGRGTSAASRCMNSSGDITMCVVPSRHAVFSLSTTCPALLHCTRSSVLRRAGDVAAKLLQPLALVGAAAYRGVQAEALHIGTQRLGEGGVAGHGALRREDLLPGARVKGD